MLPHHLSGSFKRYKKEANHSIGWLAQTASDLGFKLNSNAAPAPAPEITTSKGPQLKGKARKAAREQATAVPTESQHEQRGRLTTAELLGCAQKIMPAKSAAFQVPRDVYGSLVKAVKLRVQCSSRFAEQECDTLQDSNATHTYFSATLYRIQLLLEPFVEPPPNTGLRLLIYFLTQHPLPTRSSYWDRWPSLMMRNR